MFGLPPLPRTGFLVVLGAMFAGGPLLAQETDGETGSPPPAVAAESASAPAVPAPPSETEVEAASAPAPAPAVVTEPPPPVTDAPPVLPGVAPAPTLVRGVFRLALGDATIFPQARVRLAPEGAGAGQAVPEAPDLIPAGIGVTMDGGGSYLWDAVECRLLAVWQGALPVPDERGVREVPESRAFVASGSHPLAANIEAFGLPLFQGYRREEGQPVFRYLFGKLAVSETVLAPETGPEGLRCRIRYGIKCERSGGNLVMTLPETLRPLVSSTAGEWQDSQLVLSLKQAEDFTLSFPLQMAAPVPAPAPGVPASSASVPAPGAPTPP